MLTTSRNITINLTTGPGVMVRLYKKRHVLAVIIIGITVLYGCSQSEKKSDSTERVYASVEGSDLTESVMQSLVPAEFYDKLTPTHRKEIISQWVDNELLYQEALRLGINKEPKIERILEKSKRNLLGAEMLERYLATIDPPEDAELKSYYEENSDLFILQSDEYSVRFALFDTMNDARGFYNRVKLGASFSDLAKEESTDPSARTGGALGAINEQSVESAVWEEIINTYERLGLRKISNPFSVIDGFSIVIVDEVYEMGTLKPFELVHDQVLDFFMMEKRNEAKRSLIKKLTVKSKIQYFF